MKTSAIFAALPIFEAAGCKNPLDEKYDHVTIEDCSGTHMALGDRFGGLKSFPLSKDSSAPDCKNLQDGKFWNVTMSKNTSQSDEKLNAYDFVNAVKN